MTCVLHTSHFITVNKHIIANLYEEEEKNTIHKHKHLHGIPSNNKCHDILRLLTNILCCRQIAADVDRCEAAAFWFLELVFWILSVCLYVSFVFFVFVWLAWLPSSSSSSLLYVIPCAMCNENVDCDYQCTNTSTYSERIYLFCLPLFLGVQLLRLLLFVLSATLFFCVSFSHFVFIMLI